MQANRFVYGNTLHELAKKDPRIVIVDSDTTKTLNYESFVKEFPERRFSCGIAEQNMVSVAAGLATCGLIPVAGSFAVFTSMRALDQVRNGVCYNNFNVKLIGSHAGLETGPDGATHQAIEDIAIMRSLPNMKVLAPSTPMMTKALTELAVYTDGPVYLRFGKEPNQEWYAEGTVFPLGGSQELHQGDDAAIIACGRMVEQALDAAKLLAVKGITARVIDMYSIKPIDTEAIIRAARETKGIVTVEDHSVLGGLGGAVCEITAARHPARVIRVGVNDVFGRSGAAAALFEKFGLTPGKIVQAVESLVNLDW
jgi:transketolase